MLNVLRIVVLLAFGYVAWLMLRRRYDIRIVLREDRVCSVVGLPSRFETMIRDYFHRHIRTDGRVTIYALRNPAGLSLDFKGQIDAGSAQQIRNFLNSVL